MWQPPDLEVVTGLKSDQGGPGEGTPAGEGSTEETKRETRKRPPGTQEKRTICQTSRVREKGAETGVETKE